MKISDRFSFASRVLGVHPVLLSILVLVELEALRMAFFKPSGLITDLPGILLVVQMFAASTGFKRAAQSGRLDPLLVSSSRRWRTGLLLFTAAAWPGLLAWIVVGVCQWTALGWPKASCFHLGGMAAFFLVTSVCWALNLTLPRYTSGLLWVLAMVTVPMLAVRTFSALLEILARSPETLRQHLASALGLGLAIPVAIPSIPWPDHVAIVFLIIAAGALAAGVIYIHRREVTLAS